MTENHKKKWTREETILAFDLYCKIPFSKISRTNRGIIELSLLLGRTPSSLALKMANLAHYDPELKRRNILGMAHSSKLDREILKEFMNNWGELAYQAQLILANKKQLKLEQLTSINEIENIPNGEYREQLIKTRVGQYFFRLAVLSAYNKRCCITGLKKPELLIASHIKPWKDSDEKTERANPSNGLCLNALHDKAFDRGLITIDNNFHIIVSEQLKNADMDVKTKDWLKSYDKKEIILPDKFYPGSKFIEYHNDVIFLG